MPLFILYDLYNPFPADKRVEKKQCPSFTIRLIKEGGVFTSLSTCSRLIKFSSPRANCRVKENWLLIHKGTDHIGSRYTCTRYCCELSSSFSWNFIPSMAVYVCTCMCVCLGGSIIHYRRIMLNCYCSEPAQLVELEDLSEVDQSSPMIHELLSLHTTSQLQSLT